jgi:hypothetical protein
VSDPAVAIPSIVFLEDILDELLFLSTSIRLLPRIVPMIETALGQIDDFEQRDDWICMP